MGTFSVGASQTCFPHGIFHDLLHGSAIACLLSEWYCNCCTVIQTHYIYNLNPAHHNVIPCLESQASHEEKWSSMLSQGRSRRGRNHRLAPVDMGNKTRLLKYCWLQGWLCGIQPEILCDFHWFSRCCKSDLRGAGSFDSCAFSPAILSVGMCAAGIMQASSMATLNERLAGTCFNDQPFNRANNEIRKTIKILGKLATRERF